MARSNKVFILECKYRGGLGSQDPTCGHPRRIESGRLVLRSNYRCGSPCPKLIARNRTAVWRSISKESKRRVLSVMHNDLLQFCTQDYDEDRKTRSELVKFAKWEARKINKRIKAL